MKTKLLGRTGVRVSELCFGTMSFGGDADEDMSARLYAACRETGINFFDCANVYSNGRAEEILGKLIARERDQLVLTSKFFGAMGTDVNDFGSSRRNIALSIEASLRRLGTDRLDVYFVHKFDEATPLDETLRGLEDVVRSGKVLYLGASNFAAWQIALSLGISQREGWSRFDVLQPMYNLVKRQAETEILPLAIDQNLAVIPYSPVGGGLLSGKFKPGIKPEGSRLALPMKPTPNVMARTGSMMWRQISRSLPANWVCIPCLWRSHGSPETRPSRHRLSVQGTRISWLRPSSRSTSA